MSDEERNHQETPFLGPSGTQRVGQAKPKLPDPTPVLSDLVEKAYLIRDRAGKGERSRIPIDKDHCVVGRETADIIIDDPTISSRHFAVERSETGEFTLQDLGSSNGTALNGSEVQRAPLTSGDRIQAGKSSFVFRTIQTIPWSESKGEPSST